MSNKTPIRQGRAELTGEQRAERKSLIGSGRYFDHDCFRGRPTSAVEGSDAHAKLLARQDAKLSSSPDRVERPRMAAGGSKLRNAAQASAAAASAV